MLIQAACRGPSEEAIEFLCDGKYGRLQFPNSNALHECVYEDVLRYLLKRIDRKCIDAKDSEEYTPIMRAIKNQRSLGFVKALKEYGAVVEESFCRFPWRYDVFDALQLPLDFEMLDRSPLNAAVMNGDIAQVLFLMEHGGQNENLAEFALSPEMLHILPLEKKCQLSRADATVWMMKAMLARGYSDPSLLKVATLQGNASCVEFLLSNGFAVNYSEEDGCMLWHAAKLGHYATVKCLLQYNAYVNAGGPQGKTPLFAAIEGEASLELIEQLLQARANIQATNRRYRNALHQCCLSNRPDVLDFLREQCKEEINQAAYEKDVMGENPLLMAARIGATECAVSLLKLRIVAEYLAQNGKETLRTAAKRNRIDVAVALINSGFIHPQDYEDPFLHAVKCGHVALMQHFLDKGVSLNARTMESCTALHLCAVYNRTQACAVLLDRRCNLNAVDIQNNRAIDIAMEKSHEVARLLTTEMHRRHSEISFDEPKGKENHCDCFNPVQKMSKLFRARSVLQENRR